MSHCVTYIVPPVRFQIPHLVSSSAINADPAYVSGTTYALGDRVLRVAAPARGWMKGVSMLRVFESLVASNNTDPLFDATKWLNVGPANTAAMFTSRLAEVTTGTGALSVVVKPMDMVTCVAFFGLVGDSITLTVRAASGGVRSTETKDLVSRPGVVDWFTYLTAPFEQTTQAIFLPLTCLPGDTIEVVIDGPAAGCARMVYGQLTELGHGPDYGAGWGMDNYTSSDEDEFGFVDPELGDYAPRNTITFNVDKPRVNASLNALIALRGTPSVLIASQDPDYLGALVNFGLVRDPSLVLALPSASVMSFEFKGFV